MSFQPNQDLLDILRRTLRKLDMDPDQDRPALAEFKRILQHRISKIQDTRTPELEDWNTPQFQMKGH